MTDSETPVPFDLQIGGFLQKKSTDGFSSANSFQKTFLIVGTELLKPHTDHEAHFYEPSTGQCPEELREIIPPYYGVKEVDGSKFMSMENLTHGMVRPSIVDVKLGTRTYDPLATEEKIRYELSKYAPQTEFGFRVVGMRVWEREAGEGEGEEEAEPRNVKYDKHWGRNLLTWDLVEEDFAAKFVAGMSPAQRDTLVSELTKIVDIMGRVGSPKLLLFASSLFIAYDAEGEGRIHVKLIDFGHVFVRADHPGHEDGVLHGLTHLLRVFKKVLQVEG